MAKSEKYDEKYQYAVQLTRVVTLFGTKLLPRHPTTLSGRALNLLVEQGDEDAVGSAKRVE